jgi:hypothetical protein
VNNPLTRFHQTLPGTLAPVEPSIPQQGTDFMLSDYVIEEAVSLCAAIHGMLLTEDVLVC